MHKILQLPDDDPPMPPNWVDMVDLPLSQFGIVYHPWLSGARQSNKGSSRRSMCQMRRKGR
ncbi:MAG: hypothetical protein P8Q99_06115 [Paracoccaceae bacterium]|nr:hypothetical protein [Paracoccaceae bacterium]